MISLCYIFLVDFPITILYYLHFPIVIIFMCIFSLEDLLRLRYMERQVKKLARKLFLFVLQLFYNAQMALS